MRAVSCTAYVTSGAVFDLCKSIQTQPGLFDRSKIGLFNERTDDRYQATEILSHCAELGQVYRIEYMKNSYMPCS